MKEDEEGEGTFGVASKEITLCFIVFLTHFVLAAQKYSTQSTESKAHTKSPPSF